MCLSLCCRRLAQKHLSLGDFEEAAKHAREAIKLDHESAAAHHTYSCVMAELGNTTEAAAERQLAVELDLAKRLREEEPSCSDAEMLAPSTKQARGNPHKSSLL